MKDMRHKAGYKNTIAAKALGLTPPQLSYIEQQRMMPRRETLKRMCELYGVIPTDLYTVEELDLINALKPLVKEDKPKTQRVRFKASADIDKAGYKFLQRMAKRNGGSVADLVREAIREYIEKRRPPKRPTNHH